MRRPLLLSLATFLLLLPAAQAQAPTSSLAFEGASQKYIASNETQLVPVRVILTISNVVCTASVPLKVMLTSNVKGSNQSASNATLSAIPVPAELSYTVSQGAYGSNAALPSARPYREGRDATVAVTAHNLSAPTSIEVAYLAKFDGYSGTDCRGTAGIGAATKDGTVKIDFAPTADPVPTPEQKLPLPPGVALLGLLLGVLVMRRRQA